MVVTASGYRLSTEETWRRVYLCPQTTQCQPMHMMNVGTLSYKLAQSNEMYEMPFCACSGACQVWKAHKLHELLGRTSLASIFFINFSSIFPLESYQYNELSDLVGSTTSLLFREAHCDPVGADCYVSKSISLLASTTMNKLQVAYEQAVPSMVDCVWESMTALQSSPSTALIRFSRRCLEFGSSPVQTKTNMT